MKNLNVVVWGLGPHALKHILPALHASKGINLYGVCTRNPEVLVQTAKRWRCKSWSDPSDMLSDTQVDVVYISTPIGLHAAQGELVLAANKHLWCEKPLSNALTDTESLVQISRERGLSLAEGFMYLYHPQFLAIRESLASGVIGRPQTITLWFGIPALEHPGFRADPRLGGGAFWDVGSYPISAVTMLIPQPEPQIEYSGRATMPGHLVDTSGSATIRYDNGIRAELEWRTHCAYRNEIDIWGTEGSVFSDRIFSKPDDYIPTLKFLDRNGRERVEAVRPENHFIAMFTAFRNLVFNSVDAENERIMITRRARLMNKIENAQT